MSDMRSELRGKIAWHRAYRPGWDRTPDEYERAGTVGWGRSRRLGAYREGRVKAYVGVQHVDTTKAAWAQAGEPHARFFVSLFRDGVCVSLRTFPLMDDCLDALAQFVR